jgi:hypothetical protein
MKNKPQPTQNAEELMFNKALAKGMERVNSGKIWLDLLPCCPVYRWKDFVKALKEAQKNRKDFLL